MKFSKFLIGVLVSILLLLSCLQDEKMKREYSGFVPVQLNDSWVISTPVAENMESKFLDQAYRLLYDEDRFIMARSLLVLRNGKLVAEAYPHDENDIFQIQNIQSCTKSFTLILTGIAMKEGLLDSISQTFYSIYPEYFSSHMEKADITIHNALTMQTGIEFNDDEHTSELYQNEGSSVDYILSLVQNYDPGVVFHYNDGAPHLVSCAIQTRYGEPLSAFAETFLFEPMQITDWMWESTHDGITLGAFSLFLKPRDCAKFGQLLLNDGRWDGVQVIDSSWISEVTKPKATANAFGETYGYYFWIYPAYPAFSAIGHGGQQIFVMPSNNLVIVYTAWPYTSGELFDNFSELADLIIKSCH